MPHSSQPVRPLLDGWVCVCEALHEFIPFPLDAQSGVTSAPQPTPSTCVEVFNSVAVVTVNLQEALKTLSGLF